VYLLCRLILISRRGRQPSYRVQQHTWHKSAEMVARYIREADKWTKNGLKGVGL
jgi:hypothetical protein